MRSPASTGLALGLLASAAVGLPATAQDSPAVTSSEAQAAPQVQAPPARQAVDASAPQSLSVTVYRDPRRQLGQEMNRRWPQGFAMISETRTVTLPPGQSTIRFEGVAEGMVGVSAIVSGLPGGTIEKNRNADLLSPAALVNGALGNRVTLTRTNPATGAEEAQTAIVRTRADGGLVLQTDQGYEAVRCAGLPERLTFDRVPKGLSAKPIFTIDTQDASGGTYEVVLTYLAWGFDWQANYVATLPDPEDGSAAGSARRGENGNFKLSLMSWLTILNDNGQSFDDAELLVIAGSLSVVSDFRSLATPPRAAPLRLTCYPIGSTAAGSPVQSPRSIVVTGRRNESRMKLSAPSPVMAMADSAMGVSEAEVMQAVEEQLGDLKLYRVPERVNVSAKGLKQIAFLNRQEVDARYLYRVSCGFLVTREGQPNPGFERAGMLLVTKNETERGLGVALPQGGLTVFEPSSFGPQLVADVDMRDYAEDQDVELEMGESNQVFSKCLPAPGPVTTGNMNSWFGNGAEITNANSHPIGVRLDLGDSAIWEVRFKGAKTRIKDGRIIAEVDVPANSERTFRWSIRDPN